MAQDREQFEQSKMKFIANLMYLLACIDLFKDNAKSLLKTLNNEITNGDELIMAHQLFRVMRSKFLEVVDSIIEDGYEKGQDTEAGREG